MHVTEQLKTIWRIKKKNSKRKTNLHLESENGKKRENYRRKVKNIYVMEKTNRVYMRGILLTHEKICSKFI